MTRTAMMLVRSWFTRILWRVDRFDIELLSEKSKQDAAGGKIMSYPCKEKIISDDHEWIQSNSDYKSIET